MAPISQFALMEIISKPVTVCYSMVFVFKLKKIAFRSYMLSYFESVCDSHNHNTCNININYKINYSRNSIVGLKVWNQVQSDL